MKFTEKQERVLKLILDEDIAVRELSASDIKMGDLIRAANKIEDDRIRKEWKPIYEPLQQAVIKARADLKEEFE